MNPFLREKKDGRRAPGYLLYLMAGLSVIALVLFLHRRLQSTLPSKRLRRGQAGGVAAITQSAALMAPVKIADKWSANDPARSYRLSQPAIREPAGKSSDPAAAESFDPVNAALTGPPAATEALPPSPYATLTPAFAGPAQAPSAGNPERRPNLFGYRDESADFLSAMEAGPWASPPPSEADGRYVIPRGTLIYVTLLTTVDTSNPSAVIQLAVSRTLFYHRRRQLTFGTRFLGCLSGHPMRDRLNLTADTVLFPDGRELPVAATAVEADESGANLRPGISAYYFPPPPWAQMAPYVSDFFTGAVSLLESRAQSQFAIGVGGLSVQTTEPASVRAPLYQASAQAIQDFTQARLKEIEQRYASYYLVPAGTVFWLQIEHDLNLGRPARLPLSSQPIPHAPASRD